MNRLTTVESTGQLLQEEYVGNRLATCLATVESTGQLLQEEYVYAPGNNELLNKRRIYRTVAARETKQASTMPGGLSH